MSRSAPPVKTYSISFPVDPRLALQRPADARQVAELFGAEHHEIVVEPGVADLLPRLIWHMDEPVADPAILATTSCRSRPVGVTVLLSGVGGDELFGGYKRYLDEHYRSLYRRIPSRSAPA